MKMSCAEPRKAIPDMRLRVVCTLGVTMAILVPTIRLRRVDLPALGAPESATNPHLVTSGEGFAPVSSVIARAAFLNPISGATVRYLCKKRAGCDLFRTSLRPRLGTSRLLTLDRNFDGE